MSRNNVYLIVFLIAGYITLQLVADVTATKIVSIAGYTLPGGSLVFALTFTWRDMLHKRLGRDWARAAIVTAAVMNLFMASMFLLTIHLPGAVFWGNQAALETVLGIVPRIVIASIVAELISELVDTEVYHALIRRIPARHQYGRVLGSNMISLPLDSLIFATLAFAGAMPLSAWWHIIVGQILFKAIVTVVSLPLIYTVPEKPLLPQMEYAGD